MPPPEQSDDTTTTPPPMRALSEALCVWDLLPIVPTRTPTTEQQQQHRHRPKKEHIMLPDHAARERYAKILSSFEMLAWYSTLNYEVGL